MIKETIDVAIPQPIPPSFGAPNHPYTISNQEEYLKAFLKKQYKILVW